MFYVSKSFEFFNSKRYKFLKKLLIPLMKKSGRSHFGNIILIGRGGGYKRFYRLIDFKRNLYDMLGKVVKFEYDPNRKIFVMLIIYYNGIMSYLLAINLLKVGSFINSGYFSVIKIGNHIPMARCLVGSFVHCVETNNNVTLAKSAGTYVQLIRKIGSYILLRLPSKEERFVFSHNFCVLGRLSCDLVKLMKFSSAGFFRRKGIKMHVRGTAMNPIDHPHGGGAARTTAGRPSVSKWGIYTKGIRTTSRFKRFNLLRFGFFRRRTGMVW